MRLFIAILLFVSLSTYSQIDTSFKIGRTYTYNLVKHRPNQVVWISEEYNKIAINEQMIEYRTKEDFTIEHNPGIELTQMSVLDQYFSLPDSTSFTLKVKILPAEYNHMTKRGYCGHDYVDKLCKIVAVRHK